MKPVKAWASRWRGKINLEALLYADKRLGVDTPVVVCPLDKWNELRNEIKSHLLEIDGKKCICKDCTEGRKILAETEVEG